ncbi:hypothetical protein TRVA0_003S04852 [Trichomonascus vanleenenianus]|uniref:uncharacterized protein n=1 Tax=Trichomonascus vanleenenianus TaxID=2268995 RepID=UPI003EC971D5
MGRPRRKISKQKAALRSLQKQKQKEVDKVIQEAAEVEELKKRQKERRRRLLGYDNDQDEDYDDDDDDEEYYDEEGNGDSDCDTQCTNPECMNFSVEACEAYQMPSNAILVKTDGLETLPSRDDLMFIEDSHNKQYDVVSVQRTNSSENRYLISMATLQELERVIADDNKVYLARMELDAYVMPTGTEDDFFRDHHMKRYTDESKVMPWYSTLRNDLGLGLTFEYERNKTKYDSLRSVISRGYQLIQAREEEKDDFY